MTCRALRLQLVRCGVTRVAEATKISWARSTFNPVIGCTKVGPGCDHCYAEALDKRHKWGGAVHWGAGVPRFRTSAKNWSHPIEWNKLAALEQRTGIRTLGSEWTGKIGFWPVFCASLADVFDNEWPLAARPDLWKLIYATPNLSWLLVTKRIGNVPGMVPKHWLVEGFPPNVRLLITVCNQEEADRDIPKLLALPCKNGVSYEPALGPIDFGTLPSASGIGRYLDALSNAGVDPGALIPNRIEWIIVGGESTQGAGKARPFDLAWARSTVAQCKAAGVPVFVKQLGSHPITDVQQRPGWEGKLFSAFKIKFKDRAGADPAEWPEDLRIQEFPQEVIPAAHAATA